MHKKSQKSQIAIIGLGNLLMSDEGIGIHAIRTLQDGCQDEGVVWIDGGTDPWAALWEARDCQHVIIIDAVEGNALPGTLYRCDIEEVESETGGLSLHDTSLSQIVAFEGSVGNAFASVTVLGIEPDRLDFGIGLSQTCSKKLSELMRVVRCEIDRLKNDNKTQGVRPC
ncbi:MAG: hydrogenase maturation protease [Candidatus Brocadiia bacterium]